MPWMLLAALAAAVGFAIFSKNRPPEPIAAVPAPPLAGPAGSDGEDDREPDLAGGAAGQGLPPGHPSPGGSAMAASQQTLTGVVREHTEVSQYTYLRLATDAGEEWAAVYRAPVKDGTTVQIEHASKLQHFHSRELNRDFDSIWFGMLPGYETAPTASTPSVAAAAGGSTKRPAGAIAIADLAAKASSLDGTQATVSGHVVKENDGIMGRNWIHLQDGTGSAADGTNDVLVTGDGTAKVGDQVTATGTVRTKQDFGSGYAYKFMLEKASLQPLPAK